MVSVSVFCSRCSCFPCTQIQPDKGKYHLKLYLYHKRPFRHGFSVRICSYYQNLFRTINVPAMLDLLSFSVSMGRNERVTNKQHGEHRVTRDLTRNHVISAINHAVITNKCILAALVRLYWKKTVLEILSIRSGTDQGRHLTNFFVEY